MINVFDDTEFQYGKLMLVNSPNLVERYNRALKALLDKQTSLTSFHIDCTGYSPEVAAELDTEDYLNTHGVNKKFILLSMKQLNMDMAQTHFSSTMHMVKAFYRDNKKALTTLTAGDVVFGELDNKQFKVSNVADMLKANTIYVSVDTSRQLLEKSEACAEKVDTLMKGDNWQNDALLNDIIELSHTCGNVLKHAAFPQQLQYKREHYFTTLFGGLYVFQMEGKAYKATRKNATTKKEHVKQVSTETTIITSDPLFNDRQEGLEEVNVISLNSEKKVYDFLREQNLIIPIEFEELMEKREEMELKLLHSALDQYLSENDIKNYAYLDKNALSRFITDNYDNLKPNFYKTERLVNALQNNAPAQINPKEYQPYFWRVNPELKGADYALVNHLLSHFKSLSYLTMFVFNRGLFEQHYRKWTPAKQSYVKTYLFDHGNIIKALRDRQNALTVE